MPCARLRVAVVQPPARLALRPCAFQFCCCIITTVNFTTEALFTCDMMGGDLKVQTGKRRTPLVEVNRLRNTTEKRC